MKRINNILTKVFKKFGLWALQNFGEIMGLVLIKSKILMIGRKCFKYLSDCLKWTISNIICLIHALKTGVN